MKKIIGFIVLLIAFAIPAIAQVDSTAVTPGGGWEGVGSVILSGVLLVVTIFFGVKWQMAKAKLGVGTDTVGSAIGKLNTLLASVKVFLDMIPAGLADDKITTEELKAMTAQIKLIAANAKALTTIFKI